jgi:heme exporter protein A
MIFRDLSFALRAGDVLLVTGMNGSGKSSLLRILAGLLPPENGSILWHEKNIGDDADLYRQNLHYIGHLDSIKPELTVAETLNYWRALRGINQTGLSADPFGIEALRDRPVRYLSAGQKRRLALSRLVMHDAPLWLLDEPTTTLDHDGQQILLNCIEHHRANGGIAIIATHQEVPIPNVLRHDMQGGAV